MSMLYIIYFITIIITFFVMGAIAFFASRHRQIAGAAEYMWISIFICALGLFDGLSMLSPDEKWALFWFNLRFIPFALIPVIWFIFSVSFTGGSVFREKFHRAFFFIIPAITQVMIWTNKYHKLWTEKDVLFIHKAPFYIAQTSFRIPGQWYKIFLLYSYCLMLAGLIIISVSVLKMAGTSRKQAITVSFGTLVMTVGSAIPAVDLIPGMVINPIVLFIVVGSLITAIGVFRYRFLAETLLSRRERKIPLKLPGLFIIMTAGIITAGYINYNQYSKNHRAEMNNQLLAITDLKVNQILQWRNERMGDGQVFYKNSAFNSLVLRFFSDQPDIKAKKEIITWLNNVKFSYHYVQIYLLDASGSKRISVPGRAAYENCDWENYIEHVRTSGKVTMTDFHRKSPDKPIHLSVIAPLINNNGISKLIGYIIMIIDPEHFIYPLIKLWPTPSTTSETILVQREGDYALLLNDLRFRNEVALNFRIPLSDEKRTPVMAALGHEGIVEGIDFRGLPVLAVLRKIHGTPWSIIVRMDFSEIYGPVKERLWIMAVMVLGFIAAAGTGIGMIWRRQSEEFYRREYESGIALKESEERYRTFLNATDDMAFLKDDRFCYILINEKNAEFFSKTADEVIGMTDFDLMDEITASQCRESDSLALSKNTIVINEEAVAGRIYETRKFPVLLQSGKYGVGGFIRDVTEAKESVKIIENSAREWKITFDGIEEAIWLLDVDYRIIRANYASEKLLGIPSTDIFGKHCWQVVHGQDRPVENCPVIKSKESLKPESSLMRLNNRWLNITVYPITDNNSIITAFVHTILDITREKDATEELKYNYNIQRILNDILRISLQNRPLNELLRLSLISLFSFETFSRNPGGIIFIVDSENRILTPAAEVGFNCENSGCLCSDSISFDRCICGRTAETGELRFFENSGSYHCVNGKSDNNTYYTVPILHEKKTIGVLSLILGDGHNYSEQEAGFLKSVASVLAGIIIRKKAEEELIIKSAAIYNAANAILITDVEGMILYLNPAFEKLTGYAPKDVMGKDIRNITKSVLQSPGFYKEIWTEILEGKIWHGDYVNTRKDGSSYTEEMTITPVKDEDGSIRNFIAVKQDISERKLASDLLNTRIDLINYSSDHSLDELMARTLDEVEKFTGSLISFFHFVEDDQKTLSLQAWSTRTFSECYKAKGKGRHYDIDKAGVWADSMHERKPVIHNDYQSLPHRKGMPEGHTPVIRELVIPIMKNGMIKAILGVGNKSSGYNDADVSVTSYLGDILWGIIEKKRAEENLVKMNAELEERVIKRTAELEKVNRELEAFSYSISHDLRTPLRHISGFIEMLKRETFENANEKTIHYLNVILDSAKRMGLLIDDLLSFSRMRRASLSSQPVNMDVLASGVLNDFSEEITTHKISVSKQVLPVVQGDTAMLRLVLINLISNAIKFTAKVPNPEIEIGSNETDSGWLFYIRDNGVGFDMKYIGKLFGVFQRLHNERDFEGTGIGLAIVKNIIERHNGRIWAESEPGKGTCFYFILPGNANVKTAE